MPFRIDVTDPPGEAFDTLVHLGALDVESTPDGVAAIMPDTVPVPDITQALGVTDVRISPAAGRDDGSVWTLSRHPVRIRTLEILPADVPPRRGALRLVESAAFGTGLHPTTALCLEAIEDLVEAEMPARMLDVGTGSGILALAAVRLGVPHVMGLEIDPDAIRVAAENARLNQMTDRLSLVHGGLDLVSGAWPLVVANIRAADLMAMASELARRVASRGRLVLSGIPQSVAPDVGRTYRRLGMTQVGLSERGGWTALVLGSSW